MKYCTRFLQSVCVTGTGAGSPAVNQQQKNLFRCLHSSPKVCSLSSPSPKARQGQGQSKGQEAAVDIPKRNYELLLFTPSRLLPNRSEILERVKTKVNSYMSGYEEFIGIKQVREAHEQTMKAERNFLEAQELRRSAHKKLTQIQNDLTILRSELDTVSRGTARYLELVTKEYGVINEEREYQSKFLEEEMRERESFQVLSNALRSSHEKERAQTEKTKYWSVFGSIIGAVLGILATTINSQMKLKQLREVMQSKDGLSNETLTNISKELQVLTIAMGKINEDKTLENPHYSDNLSYDDSQNNRTLVLQDNNLEWESKMNNLEKKVTGTLVVSTLALVITLIFTYRL